MSRREKLLSLSAVIAVLLVATIGLGSPPASKKKVDITLSSGSNPTITVTPDYVALKKNQHWAEWKLVSSPPYDFDVVITGPGARPPKKLLPDPTCTGTGSYRMCKSKVPDLDDYLGDHKYKVIVHKPDKDIILDPEVGIDP